MKKKKRNLLKLFRDNRHCIVTMFVMFVIVFVMTFDTFAQNVSYFDYTTNLGGSATFTDGGSVASVYNLDNTSGHYPYLAVNQIRSYYTGSGDLYTGGSNSTTFGGDSTTNDYDFLYTGSQPRQFFVPTEFSAQGQSTSCALNGGYTVCTYSPQSASSQKWIYNYRFWSVGEVAIILNTSGTTSLAVVSNQPLYYAFTRSRAYNGGEMQGVGFGVIDEGTDGLYIRNFDSLEKVLFADCPIYLPSSDAVSGYSLTVPFSFNNQNENLNNLLRSGTIPDPFPDSPSIIDPDGTHYNYASADPQFSAFNNNGVSCKWSFVLNDYMKLHPDDFQFHAIYNFTFKMASGDIYKFTARHEPLVSDILLNGDANYNTSDLYHSFLGDGNLSMSTWMQNLFNQNTNTTGYYTDGSVISYGLHQPGNTRSFGKFTIGLQSVFDNVVVGASFDFVGYFEFLGDPREESGKISGTFDLKNGETKITQNDITKNLNPPSANDPQYPQTLNPNTSGVQGAMNSAVATIASGAIQISTGNKGFQMSQADWNHFGDLIEEMRTDLTSLEDNNTSFPMVIKNTFDCLPAKIWTLIFLGITGSVTIALWNKAAHNH